MAQAAVGPRARRGPHLQHPQRLGPRASRATCSARPVLRRGRRSATATGRSTQRDDRGWFANTGFTAGEAPLLHTIAYVLEGLQGVHALTGDAELLGRRDGRGRRC